MGNNSSVRHYQKIKKGYKKKKKNKLIYGRERYINLPEHEKQRLDDYKKSVRKFVKVSCNSFSNHF